MQKAHASAWALVVASQASSPALDFSNAAATVNLAALLCWIFALFVIFVVEMVAGEAAARTLATTVSTAETNASAAETCASSATLARLQSLLLRLANDAANLLLGLLVNLADALLPLLPGQRGVGTKSFNLRLGPLTNGARLLHRATRNTRLLQALLPLLIAARTLASSGICPVRETCLCCQRGGEQNRT